MSNPAAFARQSEPHDIHLVGVDISHSLTPPTHNFLAKSIDVPWRVIGTECPTVDDAVRIFRSPKQAGGVITMPWKGEIMKHLDHLDDVATMLQACNVVYFDAEGRLCGSNTDWIGIEGALRAVSGGDEKVRQNGPAAVIGAGGAARAAIYALTFRFGVKEVYILNRDDGEVAQLVKDCSQMGCSLTHVKSLEQAQALTPPSRIVGSIPDHEAKTTEEKAVKGILDYFLTAAERKGVMVDMCYHPSPRTRNLKLAEAHGWQTVQGTQVIGHQIEAMWTFWVSEDRLQSLDRAGLWRTLDEAVDLDTAGRQALNARLVEAHLGT